MNPSHLRVVLVFSPEDQAWIRRGALTVPDFWHGHDIPPAMGDEFRLAGRQFTIQGRLWAHEGGVTFLRVFVGSAHAESDSVFG